MAIRSGSIPAPAPAACGSRTTLAGSSSVRMPEVERLVGTVAHASLPGGEGRARPRADLDHACLPARQPQCQPQLGLAAGHLAVELAPERLLEGLAEPGRLRDARLDQVVPRDLEPHPTQVRQVPEHRLRGRALGQGERERLARLAAQRRVDRRGRQLLVQRRCELGPLRRGAHHGVGLRPAGIKTRRPRRGSMAGMPRMRTSASARVPIADRPRRFDPDRLHVVHPLELARDVRDHGPHGLGRRVDHRQHLERWKGRVAAPGGQHAIGEPGAHGRERGEHGEPADHAGQRSRVERRSTPASSSSASDRSPSPGCRSTAAMASVSTVVAKPSRTASSAVAFTQ